MGCQPEHGPQGRGYNSFQPYTAQRAAATTRSSFHGAQCRGYNISYSKAASES